MPQRESQDIYNNDETASGAGTAFKCDSGESLVIQVVTTGGYDGQITFHESSSDTEPTWGSAADENNRYTPIAVKDKSDQSMLTGNYTPGAGTVLKEFAVLDSKNVRFINLKHTSRTQGALYATAYKVNRNHLQ